MNILQNVSERALTSARSYQMIKHVILDNLIVHLAGSYFIILPERKNIVIQDINGSKPQINSKFL